MSVTRSDLRKSLQEKGFTYREARKVISALFDILTEELKKGNTLDLPFGKMTPSKPIPKRLYRLRRIVITHTKTKIHFRRKD